MFQSDSRIEGHISFVGEVTHTLVTLESLIMGSRFWVKY